VTQQVEFELLLIADHSLWCQVAVALHVLYNLLCVVVLWLVKSQTGQPMDIKFFKIMEILHLAIVRACYVPSCPV